MKKIIVSAITCAAILVSCSKQQVEPKSAETSLNTICGIIENETASKTTYDAEGTFSWVDGDRISYVVQSSSDNTHNMYTYSTTEGGATATFTGSSPSGVWSAVGYAFYPNYDSQDTYVNNQLTVSSATTLQGILNSSVKAKTDRIEGIIPMIGQKTTSTESMENYKFYNATGVLKISFASLPTTATEIRLSIPDNSYALSGTFNITTGADGKPVIKASEAATANYQKNLSFTYANAADAFYFPIPVGTIPAGKLTVTVHDGTNALYMVTNKQDIVLERGRVEELPTITVPSVSVKIGGTALAPTATFYFSGDVTKVKWNAGMSANSTTPTSKTDITTSGTTVSLNNGYSFQFYFTYRGYVGDTPVGDSDTEIRYWGLSSDDNLKICKQFTSVLGTIEGLTKTPEITHESPFASNSTPTLTFAPSDNPVKGNVMITEFCGVEGKAYGNYVQLVPSGASWTAPDAPVISMNTPDTKNPFCTVGNTPYYLFRDNMGGGPVFRVNTTKYNNATWDASVLTWYGKLLNFMCWNAEVGLTPSTSSFASSPLKVSYFLIPEE